METKKVVFLGGIRKVELHPRMGSKWEANPQFRKPHLRKEIMTIERKEFFSCELAPPDLEPNDKFFIAEMGLVVTIKDKMRSSDGNMVYVTNHSLGIIEPTEEEIKSAEKSLENIIKLREEEEEEARKRIKKEKSFWSKLFD